MWLLSEPPLHHGDQPSRSSNNSFENTFLQITRWSAALYEAQGLKLQPGSVTGSLAEGRPHLTFPPLLPADHVTLVLPQSLSIDCQVQDVLFTSVLIGMYKYYIRTQNLQADAIFMYRLRCVGSMKQSRRLHRLTIRHRDLPSAVCAWWQSLWIDCLCNLLS